MRSEDMLISVSSRKLACVLDPALVLGSPLGFTLALRLTRVLEPWLTRAFWQLIDSSDLLLPRLKACEDRDRTQPLGDALRAWIALRDSSDACSWPFRWVGDSLAESRLQDAAEITLIDHFEQFVEALFVRWDRHGPSLDFVWGLDTAKVALDTLALSVALGGALILCAYDRGEVENVLPWPVQVACRMKLQCECVDPKQYPLMDAECQLVRQALANTGLAPMLTHSLPLAVLRVLPGESILPGSRMATDPFENATLWWYPV